jgi:iron complex transport system permease protein
LATSTGSTGSNIAETLTILFGKGDQESIVATIIWKIRLPRVILAGVVGSTLALGGLVFQALLRNPLAEPYILGISGGSAIGAILAMLLGLTHFPGVTVFSFAGSIAVLGIVIVLASRTMGSTALSKDSLLLGGVMMNAFCAAVIMFLISMVAIVFILARPMNLLLLGKETAAAMGINVRITVMLLLVVTSFMVSVVVSFSGLIGFVGLVIPHIFRLLIGPDHRVLVPACILGGASYLVLCDLLARILPSSGEMPVGIITALIGAPLFIFLLLRTKK